MGFISAMGTDKIVIPRCFIADIVVVVSRMRSVDAAHFFAVYIDGVRAVFAAGSGSGKFFDVVTGRKITLPVGYDGVHIMTLGTCVFG